MNRSSSRRLGAAFVKAAYLVVKAKFGEDKADSLLEAGWLNFADVENETQSVPWTAAKPILEKCRELIGEGAEEALARKLASEDLLGHWGPTMRSARTPEEARKATPTSLLSDEEIPFRVEMGDAGDSFFECKVTSAKGEPATGMTLTAAAAELASIPMLYGDTLRLVTAAEGNVRVEWAVPGSRTWAIAAAALLAVVAVPVLAVMGQRTAAIGVFLVACALALFNGAGRRGKDLRQSRGDEIRHRILERTISLKEKASESEVAGSAEGRVLAGQFRIDQRLASGATGIVYKGRRVEDGRPVAIKLLRAAAVHDHAASARLRREAEALGLAWHPNVVEVIDHGVLPEGTSYLVMELLEGEAYSDFLKSRDSLLPTDLLPLAVQMTEALVAIHAAGIVHRDLKPANIFLVGKERDQVKLIDFGIARVEWEEMRITALGAPLGTPGYMSPEQSIGKEVDARTDIYSLGAILYESLLGDPPPPVPSGTWSSGVDSRIEEGIADLSERWQDILRRALAPVEERFVSSKAMLEALRTMSGAPGRPMGTKGNTGT